MSAENESKPTPADPHRSEQGSGPQQSEKEQPHALSAQAQRDEEIEAIQQHSKHQPPAIQRPPEVPPAPPRRAVASPRACLSCAVLPDRISSPTFHPTRK